jgi:hypothetical protein
MQTAHVLITHWASLGQQRSAAGGTNDQPATAKPPDKADEPYGVLTGVRHVQCVLG